MNFKNEIGLKRLAVEKMWGFIHDSHTIKKMFEKTGNVLITLHDKFGTTRFIYFEGKSGRGVRFLYDDDTYAATMWDEKKNKVRGGMAEGERGKRKVIQTIKMFELAIQEGTVEMNVQHSPFPPSLHVPITETEKEILEMRENGMEYYEIREKLGFTKTKMRMIKKSLILKGKIDKNIVENNLEEELEDILLAYEEVM